MRTTRFIVLIWLLAALLPLAAADQDAQEEVELRVWDAEVWLMVREYLVGDDAQDRRLDIDDDAGDNDGQVSAEEVQRYEDDNSVRFDGPQDPACFEDFDVARLDGRVPLNISTIRTRITGGPGPVSSPGLLIETTEIAFQYRAATADAVHVQLRLDDRAFETFGLTIGCIFAGPYWNGWQPGSSYESGPYNASGCCGPRAAGFEHGQGQTSYEATRLMAYPGTGFEIDPQTIAPQRIASLWDGRGLRAETDADNAAFSGGPFSFTLVEDAGTHEAAPVLPPQAWAGAGLTVSVSAVGLALAALTQHGRWILLRRLLAIPGFSRLEKDEVLRHERRGEIYEFIRDNQGASFSDLRRHTELANGVLVHHLRILESQEYVRPIRDGFRTRFYVRGPKISPEPYLTRVQQEIVDMVSANPGVTQKHLASLLGVPRESISYHTRRLAQAGELEIKPEGRWRRYFRRDESEARRLNLVS